MITNTSRVSTQIEHFLPDFVTQEYPDFVIFLKSFYEWMELQDNPYFVVAENRQYGDIDLTTDPLLRYFRDMFMRHLPIDSPTDTRLIVKKVLDFYRAKGSEASFKFLFNLMFIEQIKLYYPKEDTIYASNNTLYTDSSMTLSGLTDNILELKDVTLVGQTSTASALLKYAVSSSGSIYAIVEGIRGTFISGESILINGSISGILESCASDITITSPGQNFIVGAFYSGLTHPDVEILITDIVKSEIDSITIATPGTLYVVGDTIVFDNGTIYEVEAVDGSGGIGKLRLETSVPFSNTADLLLFTINSTSGTGAVLSFTASGAGGIKNVIIINAGEGVTASPINIIGATLDIVPGVTQQRQTQQSDNVSNISNDNFIVDSNFYQQYSYNIDTYNEMKLWRDTVSKLGHPAGLKMFGSKKLDLFVQDFLLNDGLLTLSLENYLGLTLSEYLALDLPIF